MDKKHHYTLTVKWTGSKAEGTSSYTAYERSHSIISEGKTEIFCSSDPAFRGDKTKYNPEELFLASLSSCHMLWYLHLCAINGVVVIEYSDNPEGFMTETANGGGHFTDVILRPLVTVTKESMVDKANELHEKANELCFIAGSCNFKVHHEPVFKILQK